MKSKRKIVAGIFYSVIAVIVLAQGTSRVHADDRVSVLKSAEVESKGRIRGQDGFLYDGEDIQDLADDMALLYHLCQ